MNRSQWPPYSRTTSIQHPTRSMTSEDKWAYQSAYQQSMANWHNSFYPVNNPHIAAQPRTQARTNSSASEPLFSETTDMNMMQARMASYPYMMPAHSAPHTNHESMLQTVPAQQVAQQVFRTPHQSRENSAFDFDYPIGTTTFQSNNNTYQASVTSPSGHGSEEEGTPSKEQEEKLLLQLKDEENQSWKKIAEIFKTQCGKDYSVPALQMRYRRLRQRRLLDFNDADQAALLAAYDYWETKRWEIISSKMAEFGASDTWTPKACSAAWLKLKSREEGTKSKKHVDELESDIWRPVDPRGSNMRSS